MSVVIPQLVSRPYSFVKSTRGNCSNLTVPSGLDQHHVIASSRCTATNRGYRTIRMIFRSRFLYYSAHLHFRVSFGRLLYWSARDHHSLPVNRTPQAGRIPQGSFGYPGGTKVGLCRAEGPPGDRGTVSTVHCGRTGLDYLRSLGIQKALGVPARDAKGTRTVTPACKSSRSPVDGRCPAWFAAGSISADTS